ncbi:MAG: hypothetical protein WBE30_02045 [Candidatus Cybelea sp.]|jgi:hypothetical protein
MQITTVETVKLSARAKMQVNRKERDRQAVEAKLKALDRDIRAIVDNDLRHADEGDDAMTARLRRYRTRQGLRQVRYHIEGQRKAAGIKSRELAAFEFIRERCRTSGYSNYEGTPIPIADIAAHLRVKRRQVFNILDRLENQTSHGGYPVYKDGTPQRQVNPGVILRLSRPGQEVRFALTLPESEEYHKELLSTVGRSWSSVPGMMTESSIPAPHFAA